MQRLFKYDVAISVAEEDKHVARRIAAELKKRRVRCYYYEESDNWGEHLINLTADSYGRRARYVLLITSEIFVSKYWANLERLTALANIAKGTPHILQLKLDETPIDGISRHVVYRRWENNPEEIAGIIQQKIRKQQRAYLRKAGRIITGTLFFVMAGLLVFYLSIPPQRSRAKDKPLQKTEKVLVAGTTHWINGNSLSPVGIDSFYISNTEVTIAQYRRFCESQGRNFPPQPPYSEEYGPVRNVTWYEAQDFCRWMDGRLPAEEEWEYAAGTGLATIYSGHNNAAQVAVYSRQKPVRVATKEPNAFGLFDMTGNVAEWCGNWSDSSRQWKAVRGGSYRSRISPVNELSIAYREKERPDARQPYIGFRVVWDKN